MDDDTFIGEYEYFEIVKFSSRKNSHPAFCNRKIKYPQNLSFLQCVRLIINSTQWWVNKSLCK